jgi:hypothetical protein
MHSLESMWLNLMSKDSYSPVRLVCPANLVPVEMRQTGMRGALNGTREEAHAGADREPAAAD